MLIRSLVLQVFLGSNTLILLFASLGVIRPSNNSLNPVVMESIVCRSRMCGRTSAEQVRWKCTSSSTAALHSLHILCSASRSTYLSVLISSGAIPALSHATTGRCALHHMLSIYSSGSYHPCKWYYVLVLGLGADLSS